ncbi:serine/threonine-protein kinase [Streptomyces hyaluromycini]|uniref:serine/threonine-protein kinase n=1 Tax=Streptomyces hyaluromycini TaxID=1377993 RepID=UPI000B5C5F55|nr:serine/threonine-protein kinase [Streptomyces hyaluromycini]
MTSGVHPGALIGGRYRLDHRLGAGGFGQVWRAHDTALGVDVAVKQVHLGSTLPDEERAELLARAEREARNAARLRDHPHIVTVHDVVEVDEVPWIVMQLVEGHSLAEELEERGPLGVERAAAIAQALLGALETAHKAGVVHRDVKPANVMLADSGEVLLADFGIAVGQTDPRLTATALVIGSPGFIAPERLHGAQSDGRADLFSLGVTLYATVEGVMPFPMGNPTAALTEPPRPPVKAGRLAALITGLLEKDPSQRPTVPDALVMLTTPPKPPVEEPPKAEKFTNTRAELKKAYDEDPFDGFAPYGLGCTGILVGGPVVSLIWDEHIPSDSAGTFVGHMFLGWLALGVVFGCASWLVGRWRGIFDHSDVVTIHGDGITFSRWVRENRKLKSFTVRWDTLEAITVERNASRKHEVVAWFSKTNEPTSKWLAVNGVTTRQGGGFMLYGQDTASRVDPNRFRSRLKKSAGPRYGTPPSSPQP